MSVKRVSVNNVELKVELTPLTGHISNVSSTMLVTMTWALSLDPLRLGMKPISYPSPSSTAPSIT